MVLKILLLAHGQLVNTQQRNSTMKLTRSQLKHIIKEELKEIKLKERTDADADNEVFIDIIDHWSKMYSVKMRSIVTSIYKELERQGLDRDSERQMLLDAASELNQLSAQNPLANVVVEQLKFLAGPAVLLKEMAGATEAFGE